jgi:hypothetical protein
MKIARRHGAIRQRRFTASIARSTSDRIRHCTVSVASYHPATSTGLITSSVLQLNGIHRRAERRPDRPGVARAAAHPCSHLALAVERAQLREQAAEDGCSAISFENVHRRPPPGSAVRIVGRLGHLGEPVVSVIDHRPGAPIGQRKAFFQTFDRFDTRGRPGLGLALARAFV